MYDIEDGDFDEEALLRKLMRKSIGNQIQRNRDERTKTVGDKVIVWDASRLTDIETGKITYDAKTHMLMSNYPSIVIEDGIKFDVTFTVMGREFPKNLDLKVWNKNLNKVFRTSSDFVKLYEPQYSV